MGYTLKIGEANIENYPEDGYMTIGVESVENKEAPAFGEPTDYTNSRWPSYTAWANFSRFVNLYEFFFDEDEGLIRQHPGVAPLTEKHRETVNKAYDDFLIKYPNTEAGFAPDGKDEDFPEANQWLTRLVWLKYWVNWSLDNCKNPTFYNS